MKFPFLLAVLSLSATSCPLANANILIKPTFESSSNNPVNGNPDVSLTLPNLRAIGETALGNNGGSLDLFRFASPGVRSFTTSATAKAYFSIDSDGQAKDIPDLEKYVVPFPMCAEAFLEILPAQQTLCPSISFSRI